MRALVLVGLLSAMLSLRAQQPWTVGVGGAYGFLWPHRPSSWILVEGHAAAMEAFIEKQFDGSRSWHHDYLLPSWGFSIFYSQLANPKRIGSTVRLLPYLYLPFTRWQRSSVGMRLGCGVGYVELPYDRLENNKQIAIGSRINTAIQLMPEYRTVSGRWLLSAGVGLDHWSNGSYQLPNLGINYLAVHASVGRMLGDAPVPVSAAEAVATEPAKHEWSVVAAGAVNETGTPLSGQHSVFSLNAHGQWRVSRKSQFGVGVDMFNKGTLAEVHPELADEPRSALTQFGLHGGYALLFGTSELYFQMGAYVYTPEPDEAPVYQRLGIRLRSGRHLLWNIGLKTHYAVADHWEFGIGYRWN